MSPMFAKAVLAVFTAESIAELIEVTKTFVSHCQAEPVMHFLRYIGSSQILSFGVQV